MSPTSGTANSVAASPRIILPLIGGDWRPAEDRFDGSDPHRGTVVARASRGSSADFDAEAKTRSKIVTTAALEHAAGLRRAFAPPVPKGLAE